MTEYFENKEKETLYNLCVNTECLRYPDDKDFVIEEESDYVCDEWQKCSLCDGYFIDDGLNEAESFKDPYGTTWSPVKVKRGW